MRHTQLLRNWRAARSAGDPAVSRELLLAERCQNNAEKWRSWADALADALGARAADPPAIPDDVAPDSFEDDVSATPARLRAARRGVG